MTTAQHAGAGPPPASEASRPLEIDPALAAGDLAAVFKRFGRLHIPGFLTPSSAARLATALQRETQWGRTMSKGSAASDLPVEIYDRHSRAEQEEVERVVHAGARTGFQFFYDRYKLADAVEGGAAVPPTLRAVYDLLNGERFLGLVREITGDSRPSFCDAQVTRYLPGHFLTVHDDARDDVGRLYAYVLNLTPEWRADWGGLLLFFEEDGHIAEGYTPAFNALNIFRVPQPHAVSFVTPFAGGPRLSVTGWIRHHPKAGAPK